MIDFAELIKAQRKNRGIVRHKKRKIDEVVDYNSDIEKAKAKVEEIIQNGKNKRKRKQKDMQFREQR